jgi:hypothetical protein
LNLLDAFVFSPRNVFLPLSRMLPPNDRTVVSSRNMCRQLVKKAHSLMKKLADSSRRTGLLGNKS